MIIKINKRHLISLSFIICHLSLSTVLTSCSDWLDVKPKEQAREKEVFSSYKGYKESLAGCYSAMVSQNIYGRRLTMDDIEELANLWVEPEVSNIPTEYYLYHHQYDNDNAKTSLKSIYAELFNVITQANQIIQHIEADQQSGPEERGLNVIRAEAHAIRAFCQFDILRLFGQVPQGAKKQIRLPYSETSSINDIPPYYGFTEYVAKLEEDLNIAEQLLRQYDPIMQYSYETLNDYNAGDNLLEGDNFLQYRQLRFNYWAVKALKARVSLYTGDRTTAYAEAKAIIEGTLNGQPVISLAGNNDIQNKYFALPSECLFALSNSSINNYSQRTVGGNPNVVFFSSSTLCVSAAMLDQQLFAGQNTTSHNRYLYVWEKNTTTGTGGKFPTIKKYYYDNSLSYGLTVLRTKLQIMPLIRLSEIYLIAMETTTDLTEANALYRTYMAAHNVNITDDFPTLESLQEEVVNEYRREFYGEGVMFYVYKRLGVEKPLWCRERMTEDLYALPLPSTEFDPDLVQD